MIRVVAESFKGLSRLSQAVFGYVTLATIQAENGEVLIEWAKADLGLTDAEWAETSADLYERGLMWETGDNLDNLDRVQTIATHPLCMATTAPVNRPKPKDWERLRALVTKRLYTDYGLKPHCLYCRAEGVPLELEHMLPLARGGSNHPLNLGLACKPCNSSKGSKTYEEWKALA
jgi:hypothetical protein